MSVDMGGAGQMKISLISFRGSFMDRLLRKFGCCHVIDSNNRDDVKGCFEEAWEIFSSGTDIGNLKTLNREADSISWDNIVEHFNRFTKEVQG
jgi:hypothetical protein